MDRTGFGEFIKKISWDGLHMKIALTYWQKEKMAEEDILLWQKRELHVLEPYQKKLNERHVLQYQ